MKRIHTTVGQETSLRGL